MSRKKGRNKFWTNEQIFNEFENVILVKNSRPKQSFIRKNFGYFYKAVENSNLTWSILYAHFGLDYHEICRQPPKWTQQKFVEDIREIWEKGGRINPEALRIHHPNLHRALMRNAEEGKIILDEVFMKACGITYKETLILKKKYPDDHSIRDGLITLIKSKKIPLFFIAKDIREVDEALYLAIIDIGKGSFEVGLEKLGFYLPQDKEVTFKVMISKEFKVFLFKLFGHEYEEIVADIFKALKFSFKRRPIIQGLKPDFVIGETWLDAKLTTRAVNDALGRENGYHTKSNSVKYIYLLDTEPLPEKLPNNVEIIHVSYYIEQIKNKKTKYLIMGKIYGILNILNRIKVDYNAF